MPPVAGKLGEVESSEDELDCMKIVKSRRYSWR